MTIKLHCNACEKFIKEADEREIRSVTGKELCTECDVKIKEVFKDIEDRHKKALLEIDALYNEVKKEYNKFISLQQQKKSQVNIILNNIKPEIEKMVQEIFEKRKNKKRKE